MKKKFISVLSALTTLASLIVPFQASAAMEPIRIEAEKPKENTISGWVDIDSKLSGKKFLAIESYDGSGLLYSYDFEAPADGLYTIDCVMIKREQDWTSDWTVYINDPDNEVKKYTITGDVESSLSYTKDCFQSFNLGNMRLKKGTNTLYLQVNEGDMAGERYICFADYFEISEADAEPGVASISEAKFADREIGFFDTKESVTLLFGYDIPTTSYQKYDLVIEDAWHRETLRQSVTSGKNQTSLKLPLGRFKTGWYRVHLRNEGQKNDLNDYLAFTVTHPYSEVITTHDGAIAADVAGEYDEGTMRRADEMIRSLKMQGFKWIRTRGNGPEFSEKEKKLKKQQTDAGLKQLDVASFDTGVSAIRDWNLIEHYQAWKNFVHQNDTWQDMYELHNEVDLFPILPDIHTAVCKIASIGMRDAGEDEIYVGMGGTAFSGDTPYFDTQLQNGMLDYTNIHNWHTYGGEVARAKYSRRMTNAYSPIENIRQSWVTENGVKVYAGEDGVVTDSDQRKQARYMVSTAINIIKSGTDKWFNFISRPYLEAGGGFGTYHVPSYQPYPATAAFANMTYQLGDAIYLGDVADLPEGVAGYVFDDGRGNDVIALTGKKQNYAELHADKITYSDLFGYEETKYADENGVIRLLVSEDTIFAKLDGKWDWKYYYPADLTKYELEPLTFDTNQRVVIVPIWDDFNLGDSSLKQRGYVLGPNDTTHVKLRLANLNDEAVSGTMEVTAEYPHHFDIEIDNPEFSIEPWSETTINVTLKGTGNATKNANGNIKFSGKLSDGRELSAAVSQYWFKDTNRTDLSDENITKFKDFIYEENWAENVGGGVKMHGVTDEENQTYTMVFDDKTKNPQWFFPKYRIQNLDEIIAADADGIVVRRKCSGNAVTPTYNCTTIFLYTKDGREYYSGDSSGIPYSTEEYTLTYPWDTFVLWNSPVGLNDVRTLSVEDLEYVSVGVSGTEMPMPDMTIWDFGVYKESDTAEVAHRGKIKLSGIGEDQHYQTSEGLELVAELPDTELSDYRVMTLTDLYDQSKWSVEDGKIRIDLSGLGRGKYTFHVSAKNNMNYRYTAEITFFIEE